MRRENTFSRQSRHVLRAHGILLAVLLCAGVACNSERFVSHAPNPLSESEQKQLLDTILLENYSMLCIDNSEVFVAGPAMDRVVQYGTVMLGPLLERLQEPNIPFDAFVRYYSAISQVLNANGAGRVFWEGGASILDEHGKELKDASGRAIIGPGWQDPELLGEFRHLVIQDAVDRSRPLIEGTVQK